MVINVGANTIVAEYILPFEKLSKESVPIAGGKGAQLGEMTKVGIPVPPGFVVLTDSFKEFIQDNNLEEFIKSQLEGVDEKDTASIDKASEAIRAKIAEGKVSEGIEAKIHESFDSLGAEYVAVRSSATAEDAANASWAGELETYLNTTKGTLTENVKKCWSSLFTPRAIFYRIEKKLTNTNVSVGVVVQKMVQSEVSGVAFTVNPVTKELNRIMIEAGLGLGEAVVSGMITPDNYIIDKDEMLILDVTVNEQEKMITKVGADTKEIDVHEEKRGKQKLHGKHIVKLAELCKFIEDHYGHPQDIEWALEGEELYITQSRPVTTL